MIADENYFHVYNSLITSHKRFFFLLQKQNPSLVYMIDNSTAFRILRDGYILTDAVITTPGTIVLQVSSEKVQLGDDYGDIVFINVNTSVQNV